MKDEIETGADLCQTRARWQFSLKQLLAVTAALSVLLSAVVYPGAWAATVLISFGAGGVLAICVGLWSRRSGLCEAGVVALVLALLLGLLLPAIAGSWSGKWPVPLQFVIVDGATEEPIRGVSVRICEMGARREDPRVRIPTEEPGIEGKTDRNGAVTLQGEFPAGGPVSPFGRKGEVRFSSRYWLQVSAAGYETLVIPLSERTGRACDINDPTPAPMRIELKKAATLDSAQKGGPASQPLD